MYFSSYSPNQLIAAPYTKTLRQKLLSFGIISLRDYSEVDVFKEAAVYPVVFRIAKEEVMRPVSVAVMDSLVSIKSEKQIKHNDFYSDINWDRYFNKLACCKYIYIVKKLIYRN